MNRQKILEPSLLAADPGLLAVQMQAAERGGAKMWHLDVMDGHFVPNLSFGPHVCKKLRRHTELPIDVHLMVERPSQFIDRFLAAGAASISIHAELGGDEPISQMLREIREAGAIPAVAIRPTTPPEAVMPYLPLVGMVLLLSVQPGFGGQEMLPGTLERARGMRKIIDRCNPAIQLQLDGGVNEKNAATILDAGVDILIAGNAVFDAPDIEAQCREFIALM